MTLPMHSFHARIDIVRSNPYIAVPERIGQALRAHAQSGRVAVEGTLNGTAILATLVPVAGGRYRLYVNGGMRAVAGVDAGDRVNVILRPVRGPLPTPPDVAAGLRTVKGAQAAWEALSASRRRELLRYIGDARTPEARQQRIRKTADHLLGVRTPGPFSTIEKRPLWTCPKCGNQFVNKNQFHSCQRHRLEDVFAGKPEGIRRLFDRFRAMVEACGPVTLVPYRDRVGFMVRVRFAGAIPRKQWLEVGFWLTRRMDHPRFRKVETLYPNAHIYQLRVTRPEELDEQLAAWIREAYAVGCQKHLRE